MDAVGDRDYIVEFLFWASLLSTHLRLVQSVPPSFKRKSAVVILTFVVVVNSSQPNPSRGSRAGVLLVITPINSCVANFVSMRLVATAKS